MNRGAADRLVQAATLSTLILGATGIQQGSRFRRSLERCLVVFGTHMGRVE